MGSTGGFLATCGRFVTAIPFFVLLLMLGVIKSLIIGILASGIIFLGNSAVIIGLWPAHAIWTYFCVIRTKKLGVVLKVLVCLCLPVPLVAWPIVGVFCSLLGGILYGFLAPVIATFEAAREQVTDKLYHAFSDGCRTTIEGACNMVVDCVDFCFHSYFAYMDDLSELISDEEKPYEIQLSKVPLCLLASLVSVLIDVPAITLVALYKSPFMLLKGWQRLLLDSLERKGPFQEIVCLPLSLPAIVMWPVAVIAAVISSFVSSFFLGFYSGAIVYQENSLRLGFAYVISVISLFDEYTNDLLYLREGSCLPRPQYRKKNISSPASIENSESSDSRHGNRSSRLASGQSGMTQQHSNAFKEVFNRFKAVQIWDLLFRTCELNGRILLKAGLISVEDIAKCVLQGDCKKISVRLPAWCILEGLIRSAKLDVDGLFIGDKMELTDFSWPKDKVLGWLFGPLLVMKDQMKELNISDEEGGVLRTLIMTNANQRPEDWDNSGFTSDDTVRIAQLQALLRRLQGIIVSLSRLPTFRRRFNTLVKVLYLEATKSGTLNEDSLSSRTTGSSGHAENGDIV